MPLQPKMARLLVGPFPGFSMFEVRAGDHLKAGRVVVVRGLAGRAIARGCPVADKSRLHGDPRVELSGLPIPYEGG